MILPACLPFSEVWFSPLVHFAFKISSLSFVLPLLPNFSLAPVLLNQIL